MLRYKLRTSKFMKTITFSVVALMLFGGGISLLKADHHGNKSSDEPQHTKKADAPLRGEKRIRAAVEEGKISKEEARKRLEGIRKAQVAEKPGDRTPTAEEYRRREAMIKEAVKAGKVTKEAAEKRLAQMRRMVADKKAGREEQNTDTPLRGEKRIRAAVEEGKISREEARKRLEGMRKSAAGQKVQEGRRPGLSGEDYRRGEARLREAVKAGKISREDAEKRLGEMRKAVGGKGEAKRPEGEGKKGDGAAKFRAMEEEISEAVKEGKMSKGDGMAKLEELKKKMFGSGEKQGRGDQGKNERGGKFRAMEEEIWAAVKEGKMSKRDGMAKLEELKKKMFGGQEKQGPSAKKRPGGEAEDLKRAMEALKPRPPAKKSPSGDAEALRRAVEALKRENAELRKRLGKGR